LEYIYGKEEKNINVIYSCNSTLLPVRGTPVIRYTVEAYLKSGWEVYFLVPFRPEVDEDIIEYPNIKIFWFYVPFLSRLNKLPKIGFFSRIIWWVIIQILFFVKGAWLIKRNNIQILYSWDVDAAPATKMLSIIFRIPWVARYLGTGVKLQELQGFFNQLRRWRRSLAYKFSADLTIMTNDGSQGDNVLQRIRGNIENTKFWLNGVDWDLFESTHDYVQSRRELNIENKQILLSVSRLVKRKRVDRSIRALPEIIKKHSDVLLLIVGDGPEKMRLEQLAKELGIQNHVRFEGAVPHSEIPKYMAAADVFLSFYDWSNVGNPLLEAMMAGKCIVTLNTGDTGKFIKNGENGILLDEEDLPKLPKILNKLLTDEDLRRRLGATAWREC